MVVLRSGNSRCLQCGREKGTGPAHTLLVKLKSLRQDREGRLGLRRCRKRCMGEPLAIADLINTVNADRSTLFSRVGRILAEKVCADPGKGDRSISGGASARFRVFQSVVLGFPCFGGRPARAEGGFEAEGFRGALGPRPAAVRTVPTRLRRIASHSDSGCGRSTSRDRSRGTGTGPRLSGCRGSRLPCSRIPSGGFVEEASPPHAVVDGPGANRGVRGMRPRYRDVEAKVNAKMPAARLWV